MAYANSRIHEIMHRPMAAPFSEHWLCDHADLLEELTKQTLKMPNLPGPYLGVTVPQINGRIYFLRCLAGWARLFNR